MIDDELDLDFNFKELDTMKSIPWYKSEKELKAEEEAKND